MMLEPIARSDAIARGISHYFTGKPCPNGHVDIRYVSSYACKACAIEHHQRYRHTNDEFARRERIYKAAYREENRDKVNAYAAWYWRNHPNAKAVDRATKERNRAIRNERQRAHNLTPEQKVKASGHRRRMYEKFYPDRLARSKSNRAKRRGAEGKFNKDDISRILAMQSGKCAWCRISLNGGYHVDHIVPLALCGSNWPRNLQCLCQPCNQAKSAKHPLEWARQNGRLL